MLLSCFVSGVCCRCRLSLFLFAVVRYLLLFLLVVVICSVCLSVVCCCVGVVSCCGSLVAVCCLLLCVVRCVCVVVVCCGWRWLLFVACWCLVYCRCSLSLFLVRCLLRVALVSAVVGCLMRAVRCYWLSLVVVCCLSLASMLFVGCCLCLVVCWRCVLFVV